MPVPTTLKRCHQAEACTLHHIPAASAALGEWSRRCQERSDAPFCSLTLSVVTSDRDTGG